MAIERALRICLRAFLFFSITLEFYREQSFLLVATLAGWLLLSYLIPLFSFDIYQWALLVLLGLHRSVDAGVYTGLIWLVPVSSLGLWVAETFKHKKNFVGHVDVEGVFFTAVIFVALSACSYFVPVENLVLAGISLGLFLFTPKKPVWINRVGFALVTTAVFVFFVRNPYHELETVKAFERNKPNLFGPLYAQPSVFQLGSEQVKVRGQTWRFGVSKQLREISGHWLTDEGVHLSHPLVELGVFVRSWINTFSTAPLIIRSQYSREQCYFSKVFSQQGGPGILFADSGCDGAPDTQAGSDTQAGAEIHELRFDPDFETQDVGFAPVLPGRSETRSRWRCTFLDEALKYGSGKKNLLQAIEELKVPNGAARHVPSGVELSAGDAFETFVFAFAPQLFCEVTARRQDLINERVLKNPLLARSFGIMEKLN